MPSTEPPFCVEACAFPAQWPSVLGWYGDALQEVHDAQGQVRERR